jgi:hypothetical protein
MLFGWQSSWAERDEVVKAIVFVTAAQMLCGVAKDLTKLGGKTVTKLVTPDEKQVCSTAFFFLALFSRALYWS